MSPPFLTRIRKRNCVHINVLYPHLGAVLLMHIKHGQDPCSCLKKSVAYRNWFALPERPVSDARAPFVLPEYLKMALSKSVMRNVARFRS